MKRQFVDILGGLAAVTQSGRDSAALTSSSTFSRRRQRPTSHDTSTSSGSSPRPKRLSDGHLLVPATTTTMRRSCAAAVLACSARTRPPPSDSASVDRNDDDPRSRARPARRPTLSVRRRLSDDNKENIATDDDRRRSGKLPFSVGVCRPDIRYPRLFPDLNEDDELERSSLVRTSSAVREEPRRRASSTTTVTLDDVSAISRTSDGDGDGDVLRRVRSTTSMSSLNGAFCRSSTGDADDDATTTAAAAAAAAASGAFCSTFSYPLHSTVMDSFFDVSALLPSRSPDVGRPPSPQRQVDEHVDGASPNSDHRRRSTAPSAQRWPYGDTDRHELVLDSVSTSRRFSSAADVDRRRPSATDRPSSPPSATEFDFARTSDANCTARLRRQMGQTRLCTTANSSSSQRQSTDFTSCSRLNVDDDRSRSTLFECACAAAAAADEQRFRRLPPAADECSALPTSTNVSLSRSVRRHGETTACFTDTCRSWSSDRRRMTMHCAPAAGRDAPYRDRDVRYPTIADDQQQTVYRQLRALPQRRTADERSDRRQQGSVVPSGGGGGCPLCGCGRAPAGDAAAVGRRRSRTSRLTASSQCDDDVAAAERRRKRALLRKLRRFSDAFYGNSGDLQLKTFGHF